MDMELTYVNDIAVESHIEEHAQAAWAALAEVLYYQRNVAPKDMLKVLIRLNHIAAETVLCHTQEIFQRHYSQKL